MSEPVASYSRVTIAIHWLTAIGVTLAVALGWRMADAGGSERESILAWHMSAGIGILLLTLARIATRVFARRPPPVGARWERRAAAFTHTTFYVALIVIPLLGWLIVSAASGASNPVFGFLPLPALPWVTGNNAVGEFAETAHRLLAYGLCFVVALHVVAAIRHQLAEPASGLSRMLPGARRIAGWRVASVGAALLLAFTFGVFVPFARSPQASRTVSLDPRKAHVFATVQPILEQKCAGCHGTRAHKGGLRLDTFAAVIQGGEGGKVVAPGKAEDSEMIRRILLPTSHKNAMPPAGKAPLTPAETQLLLWWIAVGADDSTTIVAANPPPIIEPILVELGVSSESPVLARTVAPPDAHTLDGLKSAFQVRFLSSGNGLLQAQLRFDRSTNNPLPLDLLGAVAEQLVWLDLSGATISERQLGGLARLRNLQKLSLSDTATDDDNLRGIAELPYLEVLNLYGTKVTDASLATLARMPSLATVYLARTSVTADAVAGFRRSHPAVSVVWDPSEAPTAPAGAGSTG